MYVCALGWGVGGLYVCACMIVCVCVCVCECAKEHVRVLVSRAEDLPYFQAISFVSTQQLPLIC